MADKSSGRKAGKATPENTAASVGQVAEYIGSSLADLMNRKDALARQLADVNGQIAAARKRVTATVTQVLPELERLRGGRSGGTAAAGKKPSVKAGAKKGNGKRKRPLPPDDPMVAATERARAAEAKGRAASRTRTSQRSGNR